MNRVASAPIVLEASASARMSPLVVTPPTVIALVVVAPWSVALSSVTLTAPVSPFTEVTGALGTASAPQLVVE